MLKKPHVSTGCKKWRSFKEPCPNGLNPSKGPSGMDYCGPLVLWNGGCFYHGLALELEKLRLPEIDLKWPYSHCPSNSMATSTGSSSREVRIRWYPLFVLLFSVVYFRGTLPQKRAKGHLSAGPSLIQKHPRVFPRACWFRNAGSRSKDMPTKSPQPRLESSPGSFSTKKAPQVKRQIYPTTSAQKKKGPKETISRNLSRPSSASGTEGACRYGPLYSGGLEPLSIA